MLLELYPFTTFFEFHICPLLLYFFSLYPDTAGHMSETKPQTKK